MVDDNLLLLLLLLFIIVVLLLGVEETEVEDKEVEFCKKDKKGFLKALKSKIRSKLQSSESESNSNTFSKVTSSFKSKIIPFMVSSSLFLNSARQILFK